MKIKFYLSMALAGLVLSNSAYANWLVINYKNLSNEQVNVVGGDKYSGPDRAGKALHSGESASVTITMKNKSTCACTITGKYTQTAVEGMKGPGFGHWVGTSSQGSLCDGEDLSNNNKARTENNFQHNIGLIYFVNGNKCS